MTEGEWLIYYDDESTYYGPPEDAPGGGVQAIIKPDQDCVWSATTGDFYCWRDGEWFGMDHAGLVDYLLTTRGWKQVLLGRILPRQQFQAILRRAIEDCGVRTAKRRHEPSVDGQD